MLALYLSGIGKRSLLAERLDCSSEGKNIPRQAIGHWDQCPGCSKHLLKDWPGGSSLTATLWNINVSYFHQDSSSAPPSLSTASLQASHSPQLPQYLLSTVVPSKTQNLLSPPSLPTLQYWHFLQDAFFLPPRPPSSPPAFVRFCGFCSCLWFWVLGQEATVPLQETGKG